jgi:hypothetical protein
MVLRSNPPSFKHQIPEKGEGTWEIKVKVHELQITQIDSLNYSHFNSTILGPFEGSFTKIYYGSLYLIKSHYFWSL